MSDQNNQVIYTAVDIEQYFAGRLSPQQMHVMEKAALDDPFLAEAMEGYELQKGQDWNNDLAALRAELNNKGTVAKIVPLHKSKSKNNWWKAVAAILVLGTGAALPFLLSRDSKDDSSERIAQVTTTQKDSVTQIELPDASSVTHSLNADASATQEQKKAIPGTTAKLNKPGIAAEDIIPDPGAPVIRQAPAAAPVIMDDKVIVSAPPASPTAASENAELAKDNNAKSAANQPEAEVIAGARQRSQATAAKKEAVLNNFFTAQVVAPDNTPLPFTNISIKKENFGTYADAKGMVRLVSTDSVLNVEIRSVGYQPKTFTLHNNQGPAKIVLQEEAMAARDRKVIGNMAKTSTPVTRKARLLKDSAVNVEPADGWDNYDTYVANNLDIPESALRDDRHGEVELTFDVKSNGTVSNIRVNKSLGAEYDEAAKRLIQEGPQWKIKKGKKTSASVRVQF